MKNLSTFALTRAILIGLFGLGGLIFAVAYITNSTQEVNYKSVDSKISLSTINNEDYSTIEASKFDCKATFIVENDQLLDISSFRFNIPATQLKYDNAALEATIQQLLKSRDDNAINFVQNHVMVLPTMKVVHLIGEINIGKISQHISFQLAYEFNENKELRLRGKQSIRLSDFGISIPQHMLGEIKNELNLSLDLRMVEDKLQNNPKVVNL